MSSENNQNPGPFTSFGEQLRAIAKAGAEKVYDPRLHQVRSALLGGSETVPSDGGFLVQPNFSRQIVHRLYQTGEIYNRCMEFPVTTNEFKFPQFDEGSRANGSRLGGIQCFWDNEGGAMKASTLVGTSLTQKPSFNVETLAINKLTGYVHVTDELSRDSDAFESWASYAFGEELLFSFENAIVNGTGAGQPLGVMKSPAVLMIDPEQGQQTKTVVSANVNKMLAALWARSYNSAGTIVLYNQALLPQLSTLATIVGTGGSESKLWQWATSNEDYDRLAGFPAIMSEYCQIPGTAGDIIIADFSRYVIAMRERFRAEVSIHVQFISDQDTFRFILRASGQPIDRSPVIALNGGSPPYSTSPFVALNSR